MRSSSESPLNRLPRKSSLPRSRGSQRQRIGRRHVQNRLDEPRHLDHRPAVLVVRFGVEPRVARDLPAGPSVIVDTPQVVAVEHRRERAVERQNLEAVARQIQFADDLRAKQRHDVRTDREPEAGKHLFGDGGAAEDVPALDHQHLAPGSRQVRGGRQPVVPAADDDRVISHAALRPANIYRRVTAMLAETRCRLLCGLGGLRDFRRAV